MMKCEFCDEEQTVLWELGGEWLCWSCEENKADDMGCKCAVAEICPVHDYDVLVEGGV